MWIKLLLCRLNLSSHALLAHKPHYDIFAGNVRTTAAARNVVMVGAAHALRRTKNVNSHALEHSTLQHEDVNDAARCRQKPTGYTRTCTARTCSHRRARRQTPAAKRRPSPPEALGMLFRGVSMDLAVCFGSAVVKNRQSWCGELIIPGFDSKYRGRSCLNATTLA